MPLGNLVRRVAAAVEEPADAELVRRFVTTRDEAAFAHLVARYGPLVRGVCRRMIGPTDADDAAQAVFLTLARSADRVRNVEPLSGWLHAVSVRVCRKALARRPRPVAKAARASADPADEASWREVAAAVDDALSRLPEKLRQPLVLCYLDGLTRDEAAARLGWGAATLRGRLDRGRDKLRADLTRRGFGLPAGLLTVLLSAPRGEAGWAATTTHLLLNPAGPPTAVTALTVVVASAMRTKLVLLVGLPLALAGGLGVAVAGRLLGHLPDPPGPAPAKAFAPDPAAGPAKPAFTGRWVSREDYPNGDGRREFALAVIDGRHLVWSITIEGPGVKSTTTLRMSYRLTATELGMTPLEKWAGEQELKLGPNDLKERVYALSWNTAGGKPVFDLTLKGEPDAKPRRFVPADPPPAADVPAVLRGPRKPPAKEPKYQSTPLYLELAFGPTAALRVWLVLDGDRVYLDRDGNGDLTDDEDSPVRDLGLTRLVGAAVGQKPRGFHFTLGGVDDPARKLFYSEMAMMTVSTGTGSMVAALRLRVDGKHDQKAGLTDLFLSPDPLASRIVHFDAGRWVVTPSTQQTEVLDAAKPAALAVRLGTPGVGPGSFVTRAAFDLPKDQHPVGEFRFPAAEAGKPPVPLRVVFDQREMSELGVWDQFVGTVAVPAGVGRGPVKLTLSFPDCPLGPVPPAEYEVWVRPRPPAKP